MGRAIVREPQAFLMDEPLSNLDAKLRVGMRASLQQLHDRLGITTVYVTHDQIEAMTLGQRVAVMRDGRILQVDEPQVLYEQPRDLFVAAFIGSPAMNLVEATIDGRRRRLRPVPHSARAPTAGRAGQSGDRVVLGIRPESFEDDAFAPPELPRIEANVEVLEELGSDAHVFFHVDAPRITAETLEASEEEATLLAIEKALFTARVDPRTRAHVNETLRLAVDPQRFHFFDPATGANLVERDTPTEDPAPPRGTGRDRGTGVTKQSETRERVRDLIDQLDVGDAIPSERQLSQDLGVSRLTIRAALDDLSREGHLVRRRGSGTFVSEPKIAQELTMSSFTDDIRARGMTPGSRTLELRVVKAGARLGRVLHVSPSEPVVVVKRLRLADRESMAIETLHVRESLIPGLSPRTTSRTAPSTSSCATATGSRSSAAPQTIEPTVTNEEESEALGVPLHSPAFLFERVTRSESGEIVEFVSSIYRGDRYRLVTELSVRPTPRRAGCRSRLYDDGLAG